MDGPSSNYRGEFVKSPHHAWLGILTLGAGFLSAHLLGLIVGATAYTLGWLYLPDLPFFTRWVDRRREAARQTALLGQLAEFAKRRETLLTALAPSGRDRYRALAQVCRNIEAASAESSIGGGEADPRLRKLDELMWTYLRLLSIEESQERFLETERSEDIPGLVAEAERETATLSTELEALKAKGGGLAYEAKQRLLGSRQERLEVLRKRLQRIEQAQSNLALVVAEEERLDQQIKLIRADAVATKNADSLTARIDATVEHLDQTNKWLSELDEFKDLVGDLPPSEMRLGYDTGLAQPVRTPEPPVIPSYPVRDRRASPGIKMKDR